MSGAGHGADDGPPAGGDSSGRVRAMAREGDKMQSGKPRCEQGGTERETGTRREQRGSVAETENV